MAMITLTNKTATLTFQMPDGNARALHFDPQSQRVYQRLTALVNSATEYGKALEGAGQLDKEQLTLEEMAGELTEILNKTNPVYEDFEALMTAAFGDEWAALQKEVGIIDNMSTIAAIIREMARKIGLSRAKGDVLANAGV